MASPDLVIVGAGPAGIRAAETALAAGLSVTLVDESPQAGGQIYRRQPAGFTRQPAELYGSDARKASALHDAAARLQGRIDHRRNALAWALRDGALHVVDADGVSETLRPRAILIASGATDRVFPIPGWTLPGVHSLGAAQISLKAQACAIGERIVFLGAGPLLYLVAWQYLKAGAKPLAVLDTSRLADRLKGLGGMLARPLYVLRGLRYMADLKRAGVEIVTGVTPLAFKGEGSLAALSFRDAAGRAREIACDAAGFGYHLRAETQLADLAGVGFDYDPVTRQYLPILDEMGRTAVKGVYLAGDGARLAGADAAECSGRLAAFAALEDMGRAVDRVAVETNLGDLRRFLRFRDGLAEAFPWPGARFAAALPDETIVCRCEEITAGDLRRTARELGADEVNRVKAFSRVGMGRCQGRYCGLAAAEIVAAELGAPVASVGRLRAQAPVKPLPVGVRMKP